MSVFLFLFQVSLFFLLSRWLLHKTSRQLPSRYFLAALSYKLLAGWFIGWLYAVYYQGGDTWAYYRDAVILSQLFMEQQGQYFEALLGNPLQLGLQFVNQPRALFFVKLSSIISIFSMDNYWLISLSFSCLCFLAAWWLMSRLKFHFNLKNYQVFIPFIIYPSVTLWSAGLLKESLSLAVIYFLVGIMLHFYFSAFSWTYKNVLLLLLAGILSLILWKLKYYYTAILLPSIGILLFFQWINNIHSLKLSPLKKWMIALLLLGVSVLSLAQIHPNLNPDKILTAIVLNHDLTVAASLAGSYVEFPDLQSKVSSFLLYTPKAVLNGLFAPLPWLQGVNLLHFIAGLENLLLLILTVWAAVVWSKKKLAINQPFMVIICLFYILILAGLITIASPNFGSLIRYRVAYMPFFVFLIFLILRTPLDTIFSQSTKKT